MPVCLHREVLVEIEEPHMSIFPNPPLMAATICCSLVSQMLHGGAWSGMCKLRKEIYHVGLFLNSSCARSLVIVGYFFWDVGSLHVSHI
jgi:hypothetical protein